jgi:hypothetical protein
MTRLLCLIPLAAVLLVSLAGTFNGKTRHEINIEACTTSLADQELKQIKANALADAKTRPTQRVLDDRARRTLAYIELNNRCYSQ